MAKFLLINKSTKVPISTLSSPSNNISEWLNGILLEIDGTQYEIVCEYIPFNKPQVDDRITRIITTTGYVDKNHPTYTQIKQWKTTYDVVQKSIDEIKTVVSMLEDQKNSTVFPVQKQLKYMSITLKALYKLVINGNAISQKEQRIIDKFLQQVSKISANADIANSKKSAIVEGIIPDLDIEWQTNEFTEE